MPRRWPLLRHDSAHSRAAKYRHSSAPGSFLPRSAPTQSAANSTGAPTSSASFSATGRRLYFGSGLPLGRPKMRSQHQPRPALARQFQRWQRFSDARIVADAAPFSSGTLKSTRTKTRFPAKSRSRMLSLFMRPAACAQAPLKPLGHELDQVAAPAGVAPFVVVPRQHLGALPATTRV